MNIHIDCESHHTHNAHQNKQNMVFFLTKLCSLWYEYLGYMYVSPTPGFSVKPFLSELLKPNLVFFLPCQLVTSVTTSALLCTTPRVTAGSRCPPLTPSTMASTVTTGHLTRSPPTALAQKSPMATSTEMRR